MWKFLNSIKSRVICRPADKVTKEEPVYQKNDLGADILLQNSFISDSPLGESGKDEFKRKPFAKKLGQIILSHLGSDSLVIGINGKWGEGKTTVLKYIETEIKRDPNKVICIWFNPWLYRDEDQLVQHFFTRLSTELQKSLNSSKEVVGKLLKNGSYVVPPFDVAMPDGTKIGIDFGKSLERLGVNLSSTDSRELKNRLERILKTQGKRIVILMDDIDRLDKTEVQNIFKLIKLTADFPYTNYILAFDQEMVSKALGEQYCGGPEEGHDFLEKIIQVPLNLPALDKVSLRRFCFNIIDGVLGALEIKLGEEGDREFAKCFMDFFEIRLETPRMAKRYGNILTFILPLIGREVNLVDLMLIEATRVFYPDLYELIRKKSGVFLGTYFVSKVDKEAAKKEILKYIDESLGHLDEDEKDAAKDLIRYLFPRLNLIFGGMDYSDSTWEEKWSQNKRIASKTYFRRYFTYSVPEGDISDVELEGFLEETKNLSIDAIILEMKKLVGETGAETFISKLRNYEKKLPAGVARNLSLAISKSGNLFPEPDMMFSFMGPFSQAAILIRWLVRLVSKDQGRFDLAKIILKDGEPIYFVSECFLWMRTSKEHDEDRMFTKEEEDQLGAVIASRIEVLSKKEATLLGYPKALRLFSIWFDWGDKAKMQKYLTDLINLDPQNAILLIKSSLSRAYSMETGTPVKSDLERNGYNTIKRFIDPKVILGALNKMFGELDGKDYRYYGDTKGEDANKVLAEQFVFIHNKAKSEEIKTDDSKSPQV